MVKGGRTEEEILKWRIACEGSWCGREENGTTSFGDGQIDRKRGGLGGEEVERSCVEVCNRVWEMRTKLN
jgi:hypothetical protein